MKTKLFILAAAAAILAVSCNKVETDHPSDTPNVVKTTISVTTEALTKADFNQAVANGPYAISWQSGDRILVLQQRTTSAGEGNEFTYDGTEYSGTITTPVAGSTWHAFFPYGQFSNFSLSAHTVKAELPQNQNGSKSAFNDCYLMYKLNKKAENETPSGQEAGTALSAVDLSFTLKGLTSVIKLNVPAALNLKTITLTGKDESDADVYLAGNITLQTAKGDFGMLNAGSGNIRKGNKTSVVVDAGAGTLSGDVYIYLLPDNYIPSGDDRYYYSSARTLNFQFVNADGFTCSVPVSIAADHPLKSGVLYNFGSLPSSLPFEFNFNLTLDPSDNFKLIATGGPDGMTMSPSTVYPSAGGYTQVTVSAPGCADKVVGVYFNNWSLTSDSDFWTNALAAGITSGAAITTKTVFDTYGLVCTASGGATLTPAANYITFHRGNDSSNNSPSLSINPLFNANASIAVSCSSNGSKNRTLTISYDGVQKGSITTTAGTPAEKILVDLPSTSTSKSVTVQPSGTGQRVWRVVWMEWGENVIKNNPAPSAATEPVSGTLNYDI